MYGTVGEYRADEEDWSNYVERMNCFFVANEVVSVDKKRARFLSVVGPKSYAVLRGLSANKPTSKTFDELCQLMEDHIHPAANEIHERFLFNSRVRKDAETISEFVAALVKLIEKCNYGDKVSEQIRDRLVYGVRNEKVQQRLLSEKV